MNGPYLITAIHPFPINHQVVPAGHDLKLATQVAERLSEGEPRSKFSVVDKQTRETLGTFGPRNINPPAGPNSPATPHKPQLTPGCFAG